MVVKAYKQSKAKWMCNSVPCRALKWKIASLKLTEAHAILVFSSGKSNE